MKKITLVTIVSCFLVSPSALSEMASFQTIDEKAEISWDRSLTMGPDSAALEKTDQILLAADQRIATSPAVFEGLNDFDSEVKKQAILALARVGIRGHVKVIKPFLTHSEPGVRHYAAFALGLLGGDEAFQSLNHRIKAEPEPDVQGEMIKALGQTGHDESEETLSKWLANEHKSAQAAAAHGLALLWTWHAAKAHFHPKLQLKLLTFSQDRGPLGVRAAFALARVKEKSLAVKSPELNAAIKNSSDIQAKALLLRVSGRVKTRGKALLQTQLTQIASKHLGVKIEAIAAVPSKSLLAGNTAFFRELFREALEKSAAEDPHTTVRLGAIRGLGLLASRKSLTFLTKLSELDDLEVKSEALHSLFQIDETFAKGLLEKFWQSGQTNQQIAAIRNLKNLPIEGLPRLTSVIDLVSPTSSLSHAVQALETLLEMDEKISEKRRNSLVKAIDERLKTQKDLALVYHASQVVAKFSLKANAQTLAQNYAKYKGRENIEAKVAILKALAKVGNTTLLPYIEKALGDPDAAVAKAAQAAIFEIKGLKDQKELFVENSVPFPSPTSMTLVRQSKNRQAEIFTNKGQFTLQMLTEAPFTAHNFLSLAVDGFYNGLDFHRVVANFVVQGGDPRGDGFGGPGFFIREELSPLTHERGTVGIATAGKDTGGSQFFVNLAPNLHLDGHYTIFAKVIKGMDVVEKLGQGDRIERIVLPVWQDIAAKPSKSARPPKD